MTKIFGLFVVAMLWSGGQGVWEAVGNRAPQSVSCNAPESAQSEWLHLSGCQVNLLEAAYEERDGKPTGPVYLPLNPRTDEPQKTVRFVVATEDPEILALLREASTVKQGDTALLGFLAANAKRLIRDKDVVGMTQSGITKRSKIHERLRELNKDLSSDFVVIDEGREPSLLKSGAVLAVGLLLLVALGTRALKKG